MEHLGNSDHNMVSFAVHHEQEILDSTTLFHDYCKCDCQSIRKELADVDWDDWEDMINCWSKFRDLLLNLQQRFIPLKKVRKNCHKRKPIWMTNRALWRVDRKSKVYKKYKDKDHSAVQRAKRTAAKETRGQSNLTKSVSRGAHSPVRGHPGGRKLYH